MGLVEVINLVIKQEMVEGVNVHAFDSKLAAMIEGCYVLRAIEMVEEGYEPQQIIDDLTNMREHTGAYLIVDDLKNLQKVVELLVLKHGLEHY